MRKLQSKYLFPKYCCNQIMGLRKKVVFLVLVPLVLSVHIDAQSYSAGVSYFSDEEYVEYIHGNLPIILSAPHGGEKKPNDIPDRNCNACVTINDTNTQELTREVRAAIVEQTGCYPYVILNRLHRSKLDANREIIEAANGNTQAEAAWKFYHAQVDSSRKFVTASYGKGIFLDLHGHGHEVQRLELGYLLSKNDLQESDVHLDENTQIAKSSIKHLVADNSNDYHHSELIRGEGSFGAFLNQKDVAAVPSEEDPFPLVNQLYFNGGYNTRQYGSRDGGTIDAIQIECHQDVRLTDSARKRFADSLATVILAYMDTHYFSEGVATTCQPVSANDVTNDSPWLYPNPVTDYLYVSADKHYSQLRIENAMGQTIITNSYPEHKIDVSKLYAGFYSVKLYLGNKYISTTRFIKH